MTAKALVKQREENLPMHELTALNMRKVTRYREGGEEALEAEVNRLMEEKRRTEKEEADEEMEWEHVNNAPGKVKRVRRDREDWERSDRPIPKWSKKRV